MVVVVDIVTSHQLHNYDSSFALVSKCECVCCYDERFTTIDWLLLIIMLLKVIIDIWV